MDFELPVEYINLQILFSKRLEVLVLGGYD